MKNKSSTFALCASDGFNFADMFTRASISPPWGVNNCNKCRQDNWNGIDPAEHERTVQLLKYRSVPIKLNAKGRLEIPRGGPPPPISKEGPPEDS